MESLAKSKITDRRKRMEYLLKQSELFAHFGCESKKSTKKSSPKSSPKTSPSRKKSKTVASDTPSGRRHRKTEEEEDAELLKEEEVKDYAMNFNKSPHYIKGPGPMRDYQVRGLNWFIQLHENGINGILADEMGLGKTLQTISMLGYLKHYRGIPGKHLVIVPKSCVQNWVNEFKQWCPSFNVITLHGNLNKYGKECKEGRQKFLKDKVMGDMDSWDIMIVSYELMNIEKAAFRKIPWEYIVIDEAHRIKNEKSKLSYTVREMNSRHRLLLTGTPLQNNLHELWALLNFLLPDIFGDGDMFDEWFDTEDAAEGDTNMVSRLHGILRPFLLRRVKAEVEKSLLPKKEIKVNVGLSQMQREWYTKILMKDIDVINSSEDTKKSNAGKLRLLNILMQLRKCSNHPYLFDGAEPKFDGEFTTDKHLVDNCGKMVILDKLLKKFKERGDRVLIFSQMTRMLDILEDYCQWQGYDYCRLDGQTNHTDRQVDIDGFNKPGSEKFVYMLSTRAGGLGINLMTANIVIMFDSDWNPQVDLQAQDRAHRIGQKKQVMVFRLVTENSVEERIIERAEMKLQLDNLVIQQGRLADSKSNKLSGNDMLGMIRHGANQIFAGKDSTISDEDIDIILEKAEERTKEQQDRLKKLSEGNLKSFSMDFEGDAGDKENKPGFSVYNFEGEDWKSKSKQKEDSVLARWIEPPKRERKNTTYNIDHYFKDAMNASKDKDYKPPKYKKAPQYNSWNFFPAELSDLLEKQMLYYYKQNKQQRRVEEFRDYDNPVGAMNDVNEQIAKARPLTDEEVATRDTLLQQGYPEWKRIDFHAFVRACETFGRKNKKAIVEFLISERREESEIESYYDTFWSRYEEIDDHKRFITQIERGEMKLQKKQDVKDALRTKVSMYTAPFYEMKINYSHSKMALNKCWNDDEDRFMVCLLDKLDIDKDTVFEEIKKHLRTAPQFRFDWFIKSRSTAEIMKRCQYLLNLIEKEYRENKGSVKRKADGKISSVKQKKIKT
jgi:superfamily II DNA or RNA helicase